jgi:hypothetical protein
MSTGESPVYLIQDVPVTQAEPDSSDSSPLRFSQQLQQLQRQAWLPSLDVAVSWLGDASVWIAAVAVLGEEGAIAVLRAPCAARWIRVMVFVAEPVASPGTANGQVNIAFVTRSMVVVAVLCL